MVLPFRMGLAEQPLPQVEPQEEQTCEKDEKGREARDPQIVPILDEQEPLAGPSLVFALLGTICYIWYSKL